MIRLRDITLTGWLAAACLTLGLILLGTCALDGRRKPADRARQAEAGKTLAEGRTAAARDASAIRDRNDATNQSTRDQVKEDHDALRRQTDPAVRDLDARRRLCDLDPGACPT